MTLRSAVPLLDLELGPVAHGGHFVARADGRVIFVRHGLPGEVVRARVTAGGPDDRLWRADAVEILTPSKDRVESRWPAAGPGGVGGGEFAHIRLGAQRELKAEVVREQIRHLAKVDPDSLPGGFRVEAAPGDEAMDGCGYRTRIQLVTDAEGRPGMFRYRSHDVIALAPGASGRPMPLADPKMDSLELFEKRLAAGSKIDVVAPRGSSSAIVLVDGVVPGRRRDVVARSNVTEVVTVAGQSREFRVGAAGFWQIHRAAPSLLTEAVLDAAALDPGERVWDLYSGSGLFTVFLADRVGAEGQVVAVESAPKAIADAKRNAHGMPWVELIEDSVERVLPSAANAMERAEVVVLDPPRKGAGHKVIEAVAGLRPRRIVYVACDPAALARDISYARQSGYELTGLRAFDIFPHTHHVECVAILDR